MPATYRVISSIYKSENNSAVNNNISNQILADNLTFDQAALYLMRQDNSEYGNLFEAKADLRAVTRRKNEAISLSEKHYNLGELSYMVIVAIVRVGNCEIIDFEDHSDLVKALNAGQQLLNEVAKEQVTFSETHNQDNSPKLENGLSVDEIFSAIQDPSSNKQAKDCFYYLPVELTSNEVFRSNLKHLIEYMLDLRLERISWQDLCNNKEEFIYSNRQLLEQIVDITSNYFFMIVDQRSPLSSKTVETTVIPDQPLFSEYTYDNVYKELECGLSRDLYLSYHVIEHYKNGSQTLYIFEDQQWYNYRETISYFKAVHKAIHNALVNNNTTIEIKQYLMSKDSGSCKSNTVMVISKLDSTVRSIDYSTTILPGSLVFADKDYNKVYQVDWFEVDRDGRVWAYLIHGTGDNLENTAKWLSTLESVNHTKVRI